MTLEARLRHLLATGGLDLPLPGKGQTPIRHRSLADLGREDLSLARVGEAHFDAVAILTEAGRKRAPGSLYGVWASEIPSEPLKMERDRSGFILTGSKMFCTGAGLIDRALVTVCVPEHRLVDVNLRGNRDTIAFDWSSWITQAFCETRTATATFSETPVAEDDLIEGPGWYLDRPGFWQGACGPACCWAGGAIGLVDYALQQSRKDPHTLAHLGAMSADVWALHSYLDSAGREIDNDGADSEKGRSRALTFRHVVEQGCTDILQRFARAYGPRPLAFDADASKRYRELELYIRQSHAERDLEVLGTCVSDAARGG